MTLKFKTLAASVLILTLCIQATAQSEGFVKYRVKWYDSLNSISNKFKVPKEVIVKQNRLDSEELTPKMELYIPESEEYWYVTLPGADGQDLTDIRDAQSDSISQVAVDSSAVEEVVNGGQMTLELILASNSPSEKRNSASIDYYNGILMALDDMKDRDMKLALHVRDMEDFRRSPVSAYNYDFTLGPVRCDDIEELACGMDSSHVLISPLDQNVEKLLPGHPNIIQASPTSAGQLLDMVNWSLEEHGHGMSNNYIVMTSEHDTAARDTLSGIMRAKGLQFNTVVVSIAAEEKPGVSAVQKINIDKTANSVAAFCREDADNIVLVAITTEAELTDAIRNLSILKDLQAISVYCNSKVLSYDNIPVDHLHRLNVNVSCGYYVDYKSDAVGRFVRRYRAFFGREPSAYSFHGYDLCTYFVENRQVYGRNFREKLPYLPQYKGLQVNFNFTEHKSGALSNKGMRRLKYMDRYEVEYIR